MEKEKNNRQERYPLVHFFDKSVLHELPVNYAFLRRPESAPSLHLVEQGEFHQSESVSIGMFYKPISRFIHPKKKTE